MHDIQPGTFYNWISRFRKRGITIPESCDTGAVTGYPTQEVVKLELLPEQETVHCSEFNMRVDEARSAAYALKAYAGMEYGKFHESNLRDVPREVFETYRDRLPKEWAKRANHWYTEFERVEKGAEAWRRGDIDTYGRLSFESGRSSGAGFKGCCMALIDPAFEEQVVSQVTAEYLKAFPALQGKYSAYVCESADGVGIVK